MTKSDAYIMISATKALGRDGVTINMSDSTQDSE